MHGFRGSISALCWQGYVGLNKADVGNDLRADAGVEMAGEVGALHRQIGAQGGGVEPNEQHLLTDEELARMSRSNLAYDVGPGTNEPALVQRTLQSALSQHAREDGSQCFRLASFHSVCLFWKSFHAGMKYVPCGDELQPIRGWNECHARMDFF